MIDIEKFICSLLADHPEGVAVRGDIHRALKEQGLEYKDEKIVPIEDKTELKESEDERIRRVFRGWIYTRPASFFDGISKEKMLAWLEKQGQTFTKKDVDDAYLKGVCDAKHELEKQGEQKIVWSEDDDIEKLKDWLKSLKDRAQSNQGEMSKMCPTSVQDKL